jgi:hypothetical protein
LVRKTPKKRRGRTARAHDCIGATPETLAKLRPDPLLALLSGFGQVGDAVGHSALEHAADEIRAVYLAVCGMLMASIGGGHRYGQGPGGRREIPAFLAWAHAETYLPWADAHPRATFEAAIGLVVDRHVIHPDLAAAVAGALADYAKRMRSREAFKEAG